MKTLLMIVLLLLFLTFILGCALAAYSTRIRPMSLEAARAWQAEHYDISWYDGLEKADYRVKSFDGYELNAQLLRHPAGSDRYVIISHGYTDNRLGALKYARLYLSLGFHVVIYDLRGHGLNAYARCTYSALESRDLDCLVRDARERFRDVGLLGIHGESLGAATTVAALRYGPAVDFAVADCGFSEIRSVLAASLRMAHLPAGLVSLANPCAKLMYGFSYDDMRPIDALPGSDVPLLFIHGAEDGFIPWSHSQAMRDAAGGYAELHLFPGAKHAASVLTDYEGYREIVQAFVERVRDGALDRGKRPAR